MPRGDDLASTDEVKVYKDEGDDENRASQNLSEDKRELVIETEEGKESDLLHTDKTTESRNYFGSGSSSDYFFPGRLSFGYPLITPYPYPGSAASLGLGGVSPFYYNELFGQPPPAHMHRLAASLHHLQHPGLAGGPCPPSMYGLPHQAAAMAAAAAAHQSPSAAAAAMYGFPPPGSPHSASSHLAAHHPFYTPPELSTWPASMAAFSSPYSHYPQLSRFGPFGSIHAGISYPGVSRPALVEPGPKTSHDPSPPRSTADYSERRHSSGLFPSKRHLLSEGRPPPSTTSTATTSAAATVSSRHHPPPPPSLRHHPRVSATVSVPPPPSVSNSATSPSSLSPSTSSSAATTYRHRSSSSAANHVKKPLNAFMLFMKEMRQKVIEECTLKESAAINQILGRKWHSLDRVEQARYYDMARREKELHRKRYPTWSARDNYALHSRKRRRRHDHRPVFRRDGIGDEDCDVNNAAKKCRARYGLDQQSQWCKPCRRKKRCIRFVADGDNADGDNSGDEADNATLSSSVPLAADSTTELFSPMPLSTASSSSNNDDLPAPPPPINGHRQHHDASRTVDDLSIIGRMTSCVGGASRHMMMTDRSTPMTAGLISSTII